MPELRSDANRLDLEGFEEFKSKVKALEPIKQTLEYILRQINNNLTKQSTIHMISLSHWISYMIKYLDTVINNEGLYYRSGYNYIYRKASSLCDVRAYTDVDNISNASINLMEFIDKHNDDALR